MYWPRTNAKYLLYRTSEDNKLNEDEDSKMHLIINGVKDVTAQNHHKTEIFIQGAYLVVFTYITAFIDGFLLQVVTANEKKKNGNIQFP